MIDPPLENPYADGRFQFARRVSAAVQGCVRPSSVGLFAANQASLREENGIFIVEGPPLTDLATGVLFTPDGEIGYLVTAAHVVEGFQSEGRTLSIVFGDEVRPRNLDTNDGIEINTADDIAVMRLTDQQSNFISRAGAGFLNQNGILPDASLEGWDCELSGQLASASRANSDFTRLIRTWYTIWTREFGGPTASFARYAAERHLLVAQSEIEFAFDDGMPVERHESLGGLSGCSLWRVFNASHVDDPGSWNVQVVQSVGIQTNVYHRSSGANAVQCVRWDSILPLVEQLA